MQHINIQQARAWAWDAQTWGYMLFTLSSVHCWIFSMFQGTFNSVKMGKRSWWEFETVSAVTNCAGWVMWLACYNSEYLDALFFAYRLPQHRWRWWVDDKRSEVISQLTNAVWHPHNNCNFCNAIQGEVLENMEMVCILIVFCAEWHFV